MKRELGIARCGLACCLCSENAACSGCDSGQSENALLKKKCNIVMNAMKNAEKDY